MRILYNSSRDMIHRVVVFLYVTYDSLFRSLCLICLHFANTLLLLLPLLLFWEGAVFIFLLAS